MKQNEAEKINDGLAPLLGQAVVATIDGKQVRGILRALRLADRNGGSGIEYDPIARIQSDDGALFVAPSGSVAAASSAEPAKASKAKSESAPAADGGAA